MSGLKARWLPLWLLGFSSFGLTQEITVAAAADLQPAFKQIAASFERKTGAKVKMVFGSSGNIFSQIQNGAPYDLYFSADVEYPKRLVAAGFAEADTLYLYAVGKIVLWTPRSAQSQVRKEGLKVLLDPAVRKIAMANPAHAPYGKAAQAALQRAGIYDLIQEKLVLGENIAQAAHFVQSGNAQAGMLSLSLALTPELQSQGQYWVIPSDSYPRMEQAAVVVSASRNIQTAKEFLDHLRSDEAKAVMKKFGFEVPLRPVPIVQSKTGARKQ